MSKADDAVDADFLSPEAFANQLGVKVARVRFWLRQGKVPHVRLGRVVRIPKNALVLLLSDNGGYE